MVDYAYTTVTGKLKPLLEKVRTVGIPAKVTQAWLKTIGFTSSNDSSLIGVLRFINLIDASNVPTSRWTAYRGATHRAVLGEAIRTGYADLFAVYPDANTRSNKDLTHVFSTSSSAGGQVISKTVATFKALADEADFSDASPAATNTTVPVGPLHTPVAPNGNPQRPSPATPALHIDIQVHISPESTPEQIEKIFESMGTHASTLKIIGKILRLRGVPMPFRLKRHTSWTSQNATKSLNSSDLVAFPVTSLSLPKRTTTSEADIEDMFGEEFYVGLVNAEFATQLAVPITIGDLTSKHPRVLKRLEEFLKSHPFSKGTFNHFRPARYFAQHSSQLTRTLPADAKRHFEEAFVALNRLLPS